MSHSTTTKNVLYHIPRTISSPIVQILLELQNPGNVNIKEITFTELKTAEYITNVNPMGTSPAYYDSELNMTIWESGAVLDIILEQYDKKYQFHPAPMYNNDDNNNNEWLSDSVTIAKKRNRCKYLHLKQYIIATVYPFVASMFIHSLKPLIEQDTEYMSSARSKWMTVFGPVLTKWLGMGPYFLGEHISAIDFLVVKPLTNVHQMGLLHEFSTLQTLFDTISTRQTYQLAYVPGAFVLPHSLEGTNSDPTVVSDSDQEEAQKNNREARSLILIPRKLT